MDIVCFIFVILAGGFAYLYWKERKKVSGMNEEFKLTHETLMETQNELQDCEDQLRVYQDKAGQGDKDI